MMGWLTVFRAIFAQNCKFHITVATGSQIRDNAMPELGDDEPFGETFRRLEGRKTEVVINTCEPET